MPPKTKTYNLNLNVTDQVDMEEAIAATIFDEFGNDPLDLNGETCTELGRSILLRVLAKFRPDLVNQ